MKTTKLVLLSILLMYCISLIWAQSLPNLPGLNYDYHTTEHAVSAITLGMGGLNLTNAADYFTSYDNPALLADNQGSAFATSFRLTKKENLSFADLTDVRNLLHDKQFMYFTLITKNAAWSYHPVTSINISEGASYPNSRYYDFQLDKLQLSIAAKDDRSSRLAGGINLKYLTGRLIYLKVNNGASDGLIDNKVKGISGDIGFTWDEDRYKWGACLYDLYSKLWWEDYDSKSLKQRAALGFQYLGDNYSLMASLQGKIAKEAETTYHFGFVKNWSWKVTGADSKEIEQSIVLRSGLFSRDFDGTKNISYTLGSGYNYSMFRIDFAMTNEGMRLRDSKYLFSIGAGIQ